MTDRFLERQSMCFTQRPSPFGPVNSQGAWYKYGCTLIGQFSLLFSRVARHG